MRIGRPALIGVVSDTHGSLDSRVLLRFDGTDAIVHAGDIGSPSILMELETVAPVLAVRGNMDDAPWAEGLPFTTTLDAGGHLIAVAHDPATPPPPDAEVMLVGHTHRPVVDRRDAVLYVNPGSATQPRGTRAKPSVALLTVGEHAITARIVDI